MDQVVGQPTPQQQAAAGAGAAANPWAAYGLNPDGTELQDKTPELKPEEALAAENQALKAKVAELDAKVSKLPVTDEGMQAKIAVIDKLVNALKGDSPDPAGKRYREIYSDLKEVAKVANPGLLRLLDMVEADPGLFDKMTRGMGAMAATHVVGMNEKAHTLVLDLAKKAGFKGSVQEISDQIFPFEQTMTTLINSNPELRRAFMAGNLQVVEDLFTRLAKPHIQARLKDKQDRVKTAFPAGAPRGGAAAGQAGADKPAKDLATPKGRAAFHRDAVGRWLSKMGGE